MAQIYLDPEQSEILGIEYFNDDCLTGFWSHDLLDKWPGAWDEKHMKVFSTHKHLELAGRGYGWWEVIER